MSNVTDQILAKAKALRDARGNAREYWLSLHVSGAGIVHNTKSHAMASATGDELLHVIEASAANSTAELCDAIECLAEQNKVLRDCAEKLANKRLPGGFGLVGTVALNEADALEQAFKAKGQRKEIHDAIRSLDGKMARNKDNV